MKRSEIETKMTALPLPGDFRRESRKSITAAILSPFLCSVLASLGIFGGISSLFAGLICVIIHGVISNDWMFDQVGTILLIVAIPMILVGSIFLDEIAKKK